MFHAELEFIELFLIVLPKEFARLIRFYLAEANLITWLANRFSSVVKLKLPVQLAAYRI